MLKQLIPSDFCLKCLGCCRFAQADTIWAPSKFKPIPAGGCYLCPKLDPQTNRCEIYLSRPFDCRLYPFLLVERAGALYLGLHTACLFIETARTDEGKLNEYADYLKNKLGERFLLNTLKKNPRIAADYNEKVRLLFILPSPRAQGLDGAALKRLTVNDKPLADKYLKKTIKEISAYNFAGIFIWKELFDIFYKVIDGCLCIFYQDRIGMFMAIPPLGEVTAEVIGGCFAIMGRHNQNSGVSRIENVPEGALSLYKGFAAKLKDKEYVYLRKDLVNLAGDKFRHKRSGYNYFVKNYKAKFLKYQPRMISDCLALYRAWQNSRAAVSRDIIYNQMLEDSASSFRAALENYKKLGLSGYVVEAGGKIKASTIGYPLNKETFCVLFEVCDLSLKGLPQFTFREFCKKAGGYKYINVMGASDLESLSRVKLSYNPAKEAKVYNIYGQKN